MHERPHKQARTTARQRAFADARQHQDAMNGHKISHRCHKVSLVNSLNSSTCTAIRSAGRGAAMILIREPSSST